jgi:hypothetical protein
LINFLALKVLDHETKSIMAENSRQFLRLKQMHLK